jgi:aryl-alcohol dehydrogenase-like predicted oxidoreductase
MQYERLGTSDLEVSRICLGCMTYGDPAWRPWILGEDAAREHFKRAFELGINFFDTADMYSHGASEMATGKLLRELAPRDEYVLASKVFFPVAKGSTQGGLSRDYILSACEDSLSRLGVEHIDLYQIHRWDHATPLEETLEALDSLVRDGKVRYLGASSMAAWQLSKALYTAGEHGWHRFISMQNHYNLVYREEEREMIPLCIDQCVGLIPWSPLARGLLTGSRTREDRRATARAQADPFADRWYSRDEDFDVVDGLLSVSEERGESAAATALAWILSVPGITSPIIGSTRVEHIAEAAHAVDLKLTDEEIEKLEAAYRPNSVRGHEQPTPRTMAPSQ